MMQLTENQSYIAYGLTILTGIASWFSRTVLLGSFVVASVITVILSLEGE